MSGRGYLLPELPRLVVDGPRRGSHSFRDEIYPAEVPGTHRDVSSSVSLLYNRETKLASYLVRKFMQKCINRNRKGKCLYREAKYPPFQLVGVVAGHPAGTGHAVRDSVDGVVDESAHVIDISPIGFRITFKYSNRELKNGRLKKIRALLRFSKKKKLNANMAAKYICEVERNSEGRTASNVSRDLEKETSALRTHLEWDNHIRRILKPYDFRWWTTHNNLRVKCQPGLNHPKI
ncbi:hypothetical protein LAZ67_6003780 [Cordylochernes scorpioides]|uniref:Uncharacterized protein n=1 Tax=Cordylochernes scorpioides TaxID=51811 RepID=A0ABY6KKV7_9ARAC|nr:hypothetical protein LAZ67_6003780 [Cordylochernes scorpioides]